VVSYQTAWLKANHPVEFMAGVMNCDLHMTDKLSVFAEEVRRGLSIPIVAPCVNRSAARFTVKAGALVYGLGALKNVGLDAMRLIVEGRGDRPFATLYDFARRVDLKRLGKRPLEMLARAGAFDVLDANRRRVFDSLDALVAWSAAVHEARASAQVSLFGEAGEDLPEPRLAKTDDWLPMDRLAEEQAAIGFYLSGHPLDDYAGALRRQGCVTLAELQAKAEREGGAVGRVGVIVTGLQERKSARGTRFFRMNASDPTGQVSGMALFPEDFDAVRQVFEGTTHVVMTLEARFNEGQFDPVGRGVTPLEGVAAGARPAGLLVHIDRAEAVAAVKTVLDRARAEAKGHSGAPVRFCIMDMEAAREIEVEVGRDFPVTPQLRGAIKSMAGVLAVDEV
jgi:DNA polymerase III subunit alpha